MREDVRKLIATTFGLRESDLPVEANTDNVAAWDSLRHFELMLAVEAQFGVTVSAEDMTELTSEAAILNFVIDADRAQLS